MNKKKLIAYVMPLVEGYTADQIHALVQSDAGYNVLKKAPKLDIDEMYRQAHVKAAEEFAKKWPDVSYKCGPGTEMDYGFTISCIASEVIDK